MTETREAPKANQSGSAREPVPPRHPAPGTEDDSVSVPARVGGFAWRHRAPLARGFGLLLLAIIVLQNVEPTRVDLLFWSLPAVPKLVLIGVSMLAGGLGWELLRRVLWPRSR